MLSNASSYLLSLVAIAVLLGIAKGATIGGPAKNMTPQNMAKTELGNDGINSDSTLPRLWERLAQVHHWAQNSLWDNKKTEKTTAVPLSTTEWIPNIDRRGEMPCADGCHITSERRKDELMLFLGDLS
ncbi:hypothetical protein NP493_649g00016 [Ridgeia piscesae]|uniref:Uncharacterized protein n=1 Tax=Ridgeia piscesae TaxID=27915 RepID=A0AAD9KSF5_RIDPI|nr:hypothetical protein NP493_649g00016 [Ridgeia piscesae]